MVPKSHIILLAIWRNIPHRDGRLGKEPNQRLEIKPGGTWSSCLELPRYSNFQAEGGRRAFEPSSSGSPTCTELLELLSDHRQQHCGCQPDKEPRFLLSLAWPVFSFV